MVRNTPSRLDFSHPRHTPLSTAAEKVLFARLRAGDRAARDMLVNANMKFVVGVAKHYMGKGVPFEDLVSEGAVGLITATTRYDATMTVRFVSYAVWWIRQAMVFALQQQVTDIRTPAHWTLKKEVRDAAATNDPAVMARVEERMVQISLLRRPMSVEQLTEVGFEIPCDYPAPSAAIEERDQQRRVAMQLNSLPKADQDVLIRCYGIGRGTAETLQQVGESLGLSRERIRQRKEKSLRLLRSRALVQGVDNV